MEEVVTSQQLKNPENVARGRRSKLRGKKRELRCAEANQVLGFMTIVSSGSHGPFDVVCFPQKGIEVSPTFSAIKLIQVKSMYPSQKEIKELLEAFHKLNCKAVFEVWVYEYKAKRPKVYIITRND